MLLSTPGRWKNALTTALGVDTIKKCDDPRTAGPSRSACGEGGEDGAEVPLQHYKIEGSKAKAIKHMKRPLLLEPGFPGDTHGGMKERTARWRGERQQRQREDSIVFPGWRDFTMNC
jgi:hypothetical protein